ncbi:MAG: YueI family protein [Lactobacillales bacterium]|jgi:uncharacterized protein YueI|nr:YueI family protein [Lactobacillales bacterium]
MGDSLQDHLDHSRFGYQFHGDAPEVFGVFRERIFCEIEMSDIENPIVFEVLEKHLDTLSKYQAKINDAIHPPILSKLIAFFRDHNIKYQLFCIIDPDDATDDALIFYSDQAIPEHNTSFHLAFADELVVARIKAKEKGFLGKLFG